jgi:hypothetical protein
MLTAVRGIARSSLVLLLLYAVVCAQTAPLSAEHCHQNPSHHCCGLCHVGPLPFLQPVLAVALAPIIALAWLASASDLDSPHQVLLSAGSSRAPPSA